MARQTVDPKLVSTREFASRQEAMNTELYSQVGGADHYVHVQDVAAATWNVQHNLGKHPAVSVVDSAGTEVNGDVVHIDAGSLTLNFSAPFSGRAYLN